MELPSQNQPQSDITTAPCIEFDPNHTKQKVKFKIFHISFSFLSSNLANLQKAVHVPWNQNPISVIPENFFR